MSTEETGQSAPRSSRCSTAMELAILVVKQWDKHDKFRATEADKALWDGDEPDDVAIARALIESNKAYGCEVMDPAGTIWDQCAKYRDALIAIRDSKFNAYENTGEGQYGIGVCDGHRWCANVARQAVGERSGITG